jgi:hypothetical protein
MGTTEGSFFEEAYRRLFRFMAVVVALGAIAAFVWKGLPGGVGFLVGAAFSVVNFRWLKQLTDALGRKGPPKQLWRAVVFGGRYFLFGAVAYVIVKMFGINLLAVLAGLLVASAAVLLEIVYELIYART